MYWNKLTVGASPGCYDKGLKLTDWPYSSNYIFLHSPWLPVRPGQHTHMHTFSPTYVTFFSFKTGHLFQRRGLFFTPFAFLALSICRKPLESMQFLLFFTSSSLFFSFVITLFIACVNRHKQSSIILMSIQRNIIAEIRVLTPVCRVGRPSCHAGRRVAEFRWTAGPTHKTSRLSYKYEEFRRTFIFMTLKDHAAIGWEARMFLTGECLKCSLQFLNRFRMGPKKNRFIFK